jgi:hypothetical protein
LLAASRRITTSSLPPDVGNGGHAQLEVAHRPLESDLSVLGLSLLGDVQLGHDLEALDYRVAVAGGTSRYFTQSPSMRSRIWVGEFLP